jgi:hypothetical protein
MKHKLLIILTMFAFSCSSETNKQRYLPMTVSLGWDGFGIIHTQILDSYTGDTFVLTDEGNDDYYWLKMEFAPDKVRVSQAK